MEINSPGGPLASPFSGHVLKSKWYLSKRVIEVMNEGGHGPLKYIVMHGQHTDGEKKRWTKRI